MANNLTRGTLHVMSNDPLEINAVLMQLQNRIDELQGLRGRAEIYDRVGVSNPTDAGDAVNLANRDGTGLATEGFVATAVADGVDDAVAEIEDGFVAGRMTYETDAVYYTDVNGTILHGFGDVVTV